MNLALEIRGLSKRYGNIQALNGLDLDVPAGTIFGIVGPNGAGKTTLFSLLCGYLRANAGSIRMYGVDHHPPQKPPCKVSTSPQDAQLPGSSPVSRTLTYYAALDGFRGQAAVQEASRVLHLVGLPEIWGRFPATLSHGMRKRVAIAQAFIGRPELVILDEPIAGLDPDAARQVRGAIRKVSEDRTVLISSHDLDELQDLCSEVAVIRAGQVVRRQRVEELLRSRGQVDFKLVRPLDAGTAAAIKALPFVTDVSWDPAEMRMRVTFDAGTKAVEEASQELVGFMASNGIAFKEMSLGQRLVDVFREDVTR